VRSATRVSRPYPPLGLMKIATYHKWRGDYVRFVKGLCPECRRRKWDRVYIATLFTFHWRTTLETIRYYSVSVDSARDMFVGGVMATLLGAEIEREASVTVLRGLLNKPGMLDPDDHQIVDLLVPDFSILDDTGYEYGLKDAYIAYATRGCPNDCSFCAVRLIEPEFVHYLPIRQQIRAIEEVYGPKQHLILLDNNVLASAQFERIVDDLIDLGFHRGAKMNGRLRLVDFNQGIDLRLLTHEKMALLAKTAIRPLRLAFDYIEIKDLYVSRIKMARDSGLTTLSNYVLYNYQDTPQDFYERLKTNVILNEEFGMQIYSFPMKYIPLDAKDRSYIGPHWNRRFLRGIQCVLIATRGMVGPRQQFFEAAFGRDYQEFMEIVSMPDEYIIHRRKHDNNAAAEWRQLFRALSDEERAAFFDLAGNGANSPSVECTALTSRLRELLSHYPHGGQRPEEAATLELL